MAREIAVEDLRRVIEKGLSVRLHSNTDPLDLQCAEVMYVFGRFLSKHGRTPAAMVNRRSTGTFEAVGVFIGAIEQGLELEDEFALVPAWWAHGQIAIEARKAARAIEAIWALAADTTDVEVP